MAGGTEGLKGLPGLEIITIKCPKKEPKENNMKKSANFSHINRLQSSRCRAPWETRGGLFAVFGRGGQCLHKN